MSVSVFDPLMDWDTSLRFEASSEFVLLREGEKPVTVVLLEAQRHRHPLQNLRKGSPEETRTILRMVVQLEGRGCGLAPKQTSGLEQER